MNIKDLKYIREFETMPLFDESFWLAHPDDHPLYNRDEITRRDLDKTELLLLSDGHCLAGQVMEICRMRDRSEQGEKADLRAASLETLLQLVGAGFGCTLVPALAIRGPWLTDSGIVARQLDFPGVGRQVSLVYRHSFPRQAALEAFANVIVDKLPNTRALATHRPRWKIT